MLVTKTCSNREMFSIYQKAKLKQTTILSTAQTENCMVESKRMWKNEKKKDICTASVNLVYGCL